MDLTPEQQRIIHEREVKFEAFLESRFSALKNFAEDLGFDNPHEILLEAEKFLHPISEYLKDQEIDDEDRNWITTIIGYFIGELFAQKYNGAWLIEKNGTSSKFGRYIIGQMSDQGRQIHGTVDSFEIARTYLLEPINRDLEKIVLKERDQLYVSE